MARYLFDHKNSLAKKIMGKHLYLFLDCDGTLARIRKQPDMAFISNRMHATLERISQHPNITTAIVTGRELKSITKLVGIPHITYVGNHGFEIVGNGLTFIHPAAKKIQPMLRTLARTLRTHLQKYTGVLIEDKIYTLSVHYRMLAPKKLPNVALLFYSLLTPYIKNGNLLVTEGAKVWEIRPNIDWHKGRSIDWLLTNQQKIVPSIALYIGDDTTDEDAFKTLKQTDTGIGIRVAREKQKTHADYYVHSIAEVRAVLQQLLQWQKADLL